MKKASRVLYIIGNVFNVISIIANVFMVVVGALMISKPNPFLEEFAKNNISEITTVEQVKALGIAIIAISVLTIAVSIIVLILANRAVKRLENNDKHKGIHIAMIVISVVMGSIFYLIASIIGVCSVSESTTQKVE